MFPTCKIYSLFPLKYTITSSIQVQDQLNVQDLTISVRLRSRRDSLGSNLLVYISSHLNTFELKAKHLFLLYSTGVDEAGVSILILENSKKGMSIEVTSTI